MSNSKLEKDLKSDPPCHIAACAIQTCLNKKGYDEGLCIDQVNALYRCCELFYKRNGDTARSASCPKFHILMMKLEQRKMR